MRRVSRSRFQRWGASGVAFLYFSLLGLPAAFFGGGMAVDFTRIIIANRQVSNSAQAAALSGAQQFLEDTAYLDSSRAVTAAQRTWCLEQADGAMTLSDATPASQSVPCPGGVRASIKVTPLSATGSPSSGPFTKVEVTVSYQVKGLLFAGFFGASGSDKVTLTKTAEVCNPDDPTGQTGGFCAAPSQ